MTEQGPGSDSDKSGGRSSYPSWGELFSLSATLATLSLAALYLAGWQFATHYLKGFQLGITGAGLSFDFLPAIGLRVMTDHPMETAIIVFVLVVFLWVVGPSQNQSIPAKISIPVAGVAIITFFVTVGIGGHLAGTAAFESLIDGNYRDLPRVSVRTLDPAAGDEMAGGAETLETGCHRLLLVNRQAVFVVRPRQGEKGPVLPIVSLPRHRIASLTILTQRGNCP